MMTVNNEQRFPGNSKKKKKDVTKPCLLHGAQRMVRRPCMAENVSCTSRQLQTCHTAILQSRQNWNGNRAVQTLYAYHIQG